jgi:ATP-binding cassette subfamily F protein 3
MLSRFGFDKLKSDTKVGALSGGEKARLLFCLMSFEAPHIMLLDEPTNHLDIDAREALIQALNNYNGAVILVSHDTHLVECVADQLWLVADGTCKSFDDDLDTYRKLVIKQRKLEREKLKQEARSQKQDPKPAASSKDDKEAEKLEHQISDLTSRLHALEGEIAACYGQHDEAKRVKKLNASYAEAQGELERAEAALEKLILSL